uniref:Uncharacterized protein n=1 Tax=viral metagenome TaxID=1070528 RepID=A0A6C0JWR5_9ZZZZ
MHQKNLPHHLPHELGLKHQLGLLQGHNDEGHLHPHHYLCLVWEEEEVLLSNTRRKAESSAQRAAVADEEARQIAVARAESV